MSYVLDQSFLPEKYFEEICQYPHGSYHEKPLSDHIVRFAEDHGLRYRQYPNWNVIIYKPASPGYEDHDPVMLQAHIDMVCEKEPGYEHDFEKDPISLYVEDGFVHARGTTLGADDGVGVAYMMSILHDDSIPHPPLECVFTVQEEVGLGGCAELAFEDLTAKRMIGLDDMGGNTSYVSACGSQYMILSRQYERSVNDLPGYRLTVGGLTGGHSGACINKERGNAVKLSNRVLYEISKDHTIRIGDCDCGGKDNVIPRHANIIFGSDAGLKCLQKKAEEIEAIFRGELEFSDPDVTVVIEPIECAEAFSPEDSRQIIEFLYVLPNGLRHKSMAIDNLTTVSENLANVRTRGDEITIRCFARSEIESLLDVMADEYTILSRLYGYDIRLENRAPGWKYDEHSRIRETLFNAFHDVTGEYMTPIAEHGGLETGYMCGGIPGIDIVTCGPYCDGYHTTEERLNLESFRVTYEVLKRTLSEL